MSELISLSNVGNILSNICNTLIENNNLLLLIKYDTSDALSQTNLTNEEIIELCGKGSDPINQQRIFKYPYYDNVVDEIRSELRVFAPIIKPNNIYLAELSISLQIIVHNSIIDLDENKQRPIEIIKEILETLNGNDDIGGIGSLILNSSINIVSWNNRFSGYVFNMNTRAI
jgi:hypothetical protein